LCVYKSVSFQLLYESSCCSVGTCWSNPSLSKRRASAQGSITDVRLGGASGGTEVIAARSLRIGQRYHMHSSCLLCICNMPYSYCTFNWQLYTCGRLVGQTHFTIMSVPSSFIFLCLRCISLVQCYASCQT